MTWIAATEKDTDNRALEKRLEDTTGQFRPKKCEVRVANSEVQSVRHSQFVIRRSSLLSIYGVERTDETVRLCRPNLAFAN
jgi:hypothetical protein